MTPISVNDLRTTKFQNRQKSGFVTNQDLGDLTANDLKLIVAALNSIGGVYLKKVSYTVGTADTDADYKFTSVANMTEQSLQLGAAAIIPADSPVSSIVAKCEVAMVGGGSSSDIGKTSGSEEYIAGVDLSALNAINSVGQNVAPSVAASSIYFSATPDANWSTLTAWKVRVDVYYLDASL